MATATLTNVPATISLAESTTGWTGDSFSLEPDIKKQGSNSVACAITPNAGSSQEIYYTGFTAADLSTVHLRLWFNISFNGNLATTNPVQVFISDGTNTAYWDVDVTTYAGGWAQAVIYTGDTPLSGTKPTGNSTRVGLKFSVASKPRNVPANAWFDAWYYGDGFTVTGGTSGDEIDWSHVAALDLIEAYNVIERLNDVYFFAGDVTIGAGATTTYFKSGQKVQFADLPVLSTLYGVTFEGSACNVDITGGSYGAAGTQNYTFDASDININSFVMSGVQFEKASTVDFAAGETISTTTFSNCGQVDPSTATFSGIIFSNYVGTTGAMIFPSDDSNISDIEFINCDNGVEYAASSDSTTPTFSAFTFDDVSGNYDVNNTSGSAVTITIADGGNANSYNPGGSTVTFDNPITHTLTGMQENSEVTYMERGTAVDTGSDGATTVDSRNFVTGNAWTIDAYKGHLLYITSGADAGRYYVVSNTATTLKLDAELTATASSITYELYDENDDVELFHLETVTSSGESAYNYTYTADKSVDIYITHTNYVNITLVDITLGNSNASIPIGQVVDENYFNPV